MIHNFGALLTAAALFPLSIKILSFLIPRARAWGLLDRPGGRHIHAMPVAVVGGLGVIAPWLIGLATLSLVWPEWRAAHAQELFVTVICTLSVVAVGVADDRKGITPRARLIAELLVAAISVAYQPSVHAFCVELSQSLGWVVYPVTVVGIAGVMNAMNLVDGMDGLAGSMFAAIALAVTLLSAPWGAYPAFNGVSVVLLLPGLAAFLRKNWNPAVTFMGDHGSLSIGYLLVVSALGLRARGSTHAPVDVLMLSSIFSYPVLDMLICMIRRLRAGQPVSTGDRNHMHHRMLRLGLSPRQSVINLVAWQGAMLVPVFMIAHLPVAATPLALLASLTVALERLMFLGRIEQARLKQFQSRVASFFKPRAFMPLDETFVRARVCISLRPLIEASQFEERGSLEPALDALKFFCERKARGHGFVDLRGDQLIVRLTGSAESSPTPEELQREWSDALKSFSQLFKLTFSTWTLPVRISTGAELDEELNPSPKSVEAA